MVSSSKRFNSHEIVYDRTKKVTFKYKWLLNRGDHMDRFDCTLDKIYSNSQGLNKTWDQLTRSPCKLITDTLCIYANDCRIKLCCSYVIIYKKKIYIKKKNIKKIKNKKPAADLKLVKQSSNIRYIMLPELQTSWVRELQTNNSDWCNCTTLENKNLNDTNGLFIFNFFNIFFFNIYFFFINYYICKIVVGYPLWKKEGSVSH
jgi:hypothetical protein